jgi:hypothetical protein
MNRLALLGILVLFGGVAVAQQDMGNVAVAGATYTTGVVEMTTRDSMSIRKDSGEVVTVLINSATVGAQERPVGTRVRVDFHRDNDNRAIADEIQGIAPVVAEAAATMPLGTGTQATPATAPETSAPAETTAAPVTETPAPVADKLPATASTLPGLALLGLLAISGAVTLRAVR